MSRSARAVGVIGAVAALSSACTVGPDYQRPALTPPAAIRGAESAPPGPSLGDAAWSDVFQDDELRALIRTALAGNTDVRIAASRVLQAQAVLGITKADAYPTVDGAVDAGGGRIAATDSAAARTAAAIRVGATARWEIDFWGKYRRATEAARAQLLASEWGQRAVASSVVSAVAQAYYGLRSLDLQLAIARRTLTSRQESLGLTQVRERGGVTSLVDVREAEQLVFGAGATIVELERRIAQQENLISVLTGGFPSTVTRGLELVAQPLPPAVPADLPSALLARRPDIQQAEQALIAANAQIGVARAAYFPSIALTGSGGLQSTALRTLISGGAGIWTAAVGVAQPIVTAGRTKSQVALAQARAEEATVIYADAIRQAFREASDALVGHVKARELRAELERLTTAAQDARRLADIRYRGGAASYLEVLDADTRLFTAELRLAEAQEDELVSFVEIYRALGAGWQQDGRPGAAPPTTP
ncbi:MAG: efflux transporter outer membrane subunit [Vicinamibacteria bacterium]